MALCELLHLALGHLEIDLQQRLLIHRALVLRIDLLESSFKIIHLITPLLIILAEAFLQALISVLDLIQLNVQLKVLFDLRLQIHQHILLALGKGCIGLIHLLSYLSGSDLFDIDGSCACNLRVELVTKLVTLPQSLSLGIRECLTCLNNRVLVLHQALQVLGRQQDEVAVPCVHLLLGDGLIAISYQVEQMVSLLPRALLLALVTLDKLSEFRGPCCHSAFVYLLTVVSLCFLLKLLDNLILLTQLEVEITQLILQDSSKIILRVFGLRVWLGL